MVKALKSKPIYIELGPTMVLEKNGVLKWVLKSISLEPITSQEPQNKELQLSTSPTSNELSADEKAEQFIIPSAEKCENSHVIATSSTISTLVHSQLMPTPLPSTTSQESSLSEAELKVRRSLDFSQFESSTDPKDSIS